MPTPTPEHNHNEERRLLPVLKDRVSSAEGMMNSGEMRAIAGLALAAAAVALLFKEFRLVALDAAFAHAQGWPVQAIDLMLMALVALVTVIGLQTVGLILIVALLIVPPAAARFWTDRLATMTVIAAVFGALSGWIGATLSALFPRLPAGGVIVLVAGALFAVSFLFAPARGVVAVGLRSLRLRLAYAEQVALCRLRTAAESGGGAPGLSRLLARWLWARGLVMRRGGAVALTGRGRQAALAAERNFWLWERFLVRYPALVPMHSHWGIDPIDRVLPADLVRELEAQV